jgi:hypothetical protein
MIMAATVEFDDLYALSNEDNDELWDRLNSATCKVRKVYGQAGGQQNGLFNELVSLRVDLTTINGERIRYAYDNLP